jgi:predicted lipoprotein with Yx(FWY)xxD motif
MITHQAVRSRISALGAAAGATLLVAACGTSSSGQATKAASTKPAAAKPSGLTLRTAKGSMGTYLVGPSGRALYMFTADRAGKSACSATCAQTWPPLTSSSTPQAAGGVNASHFGSIVRTGGVKQVTYDGHPLYYFIGDSGSGTTNGEGSTAFGARWWLMTTSGTALTTGGSSSGSSKKKSSSKSSGGYSGGGW